MDTKDGFSLELEFLDKSVTVGSEREELQCGVGHSSSGKLADTKFTDVTNRRLNLLTFPS